MDLLKKATAADRRIRFTRIPESTMKLLEAWIADRRIAKGFLFLYNRRPITQEYLEDRFEIGRKNAGIKKEDRKLVPYSLRYTFRSKYQGHIDLQAVMQMMGHRSTEMSDHYLQIDPEQFQVYKEYQEKIDLLWG